MASNILCEVIIVLLILAKSLDGPKLHALELSAELKTLAAL